MTITSQDTEAARTTDPETATILDMLAQHRFFLRQTVRGLTDEQAAWRTTVSELCLSGLIKHVTGAERNWMEFVLRGPGAMTNDEGEWLEQFHLAEGETLAGALEEYDKVARRTAEIVLSLPDLETSQPLPEAPWFKPGARWSVRQVLLHILAETAQHAGHADIIRESLDGAKTMG